MKRSRMLHIINNTLKDIILEVLDDRNDEEFSLPVNKVDSYLDKHAKTILNTVETQGMKPPRYPVDPKAPFTDKMFDWEEE